MADVSPFVVRAKPTKKLTRKAWRPAPVAAPNPPPNLEEDDSDISEGSDDQEGQISSLVGRNKRYPNARILTQQSTKDLPTTKDVYGFELEEPSIRDNALYKRYANIYQIACTPPVDKDVMTSDLANQEIMQWEPTYDYGTDSVFSVAIPVVSKDAERLYEDSVRVGTMGPLPVSQDSKIMYENYVQGVC